MANFGSRQVARSEEARSSIDKDRRLDRPSRRVSPVCTHLTTPPLLTRVLTLPFLLKQMKRCARSL